MVTGITGQKIKLTIQDFFSKCDQIRRKLRIWLHLLKKSLMENFIFSAVKYVIHINSRARRHQKWTVKSNILIKQETFLQQQPNIVNRTMISNNVVAGSALGLIIFSSRKMKK